MRKISDASGLLLSVAVGLCASACAARATGTPEASTNTAQVSGESVASPHASPTNVEQTASAIASSTTASGAASATNAASETVPAPGANSPAVSIADAANWPQWRGPNRDGHAGGFQMPRAWPKSLKEEWKVTVGVGHASPIVSEGRVYVFARQGEEEVLLCLDSATGKQLWRSAHAVAYEMNPAATGHGKGPKSTPVVAGGRVFTLGISGTLSAHDARDGRLVWRKDFSKQYPQTSPLYGTAMSPVVEGKLLVAHVGGHDKGALTAFDTETGTVKWAYDADGPAYSSPIVATLGGERQIITFTQKEFVSVSAGTGKLLWKMPAKSSYDTNSVTAVAYKDTLILSLEGQGIMAVRPVKQGATFTVREAWRNPENELYMNSPVVEGNRLFGLSMRKKGQFFCIDADTGKTLWQGPGRMGENASILNLAGTLLLLTNEANLIVLPASAGGYAPAAQYTVATSPVWAHPAILSNRILVKDETTLASLSVPDK
ncbi:MAG TPA: PQQ-binding-like beta-propeller repeat protein [Pyrinomonadaceae bacterium]|nr:PQQ-binding-like beta-propeller repeat protein [Pyrinomonadaceae bacterium]